MRWESGEGLGTRVLPDREDAKPSRAGTCNQLTKLIKLFKFKVFASNIVLISICKLEVFANIIFIIY